MKLQQIIERLSAIEAEISRREEELTDEELKRMEEEVGSLKAERAAIESAAARRSALLSDIASGVEGVSVSETKNRSAAPVTVDDPRATLEYRKAFMEYCRSGVWHGVLMRGDETTTTTEAAAAIPTTVLNEVIRKMGAYGQLYSRVRKTSVKGGLSVPVLSLKPTASWITETAASERQKVSTTSVVFNYYGLECKVSQTLIASIVTLEAFETAITDVIYEAMVKALEAAIISGDGDGKPLGITADTRVTSGQKVTLSAADISDWEAWKKKVFAKLPIRYKAGAVLITNGATWEGCLDGMTDANGQPIGRVNYGITEGAQERFAGKEVIQVEDDILKSYDDASAGDVIAILMNLSDYCVNSNMQLTMYRYKDEDKNEIIDKAIMVADGKLLDASGVILVKKG